MALPDFATTTEQWVLSAEEGAHFDYLKAESRNEGKPMVLWGWKRDKLDPHTHERLPESRTIYFSADLKHQGGQVGIERAFFFLETRAKDEEIAILKSQAPSAQVRADGEFPGYSRLRVVEGEPTAYDSASVQRRLKGKPRITIPAPRLVPEANDFNLSQYAPFALCVGSGLSAESGLPLLGSIHNIFEVDNAVTGQLVFGADDHLPERIYQNRNKEFAAFCDFTVQAVKAQPSESHKILAALHKKGLVTHIYTDNMDHILHKVDVPFTKTRLSIFPDRYEVRFDPRAKALLVVGVAVDRRSVIKQARAQGLKIISINPVFGVAPHSRNMDYLCSGDIFYRMTAQEALPRIVQASEF